MRSGPAVHDEPVIPGAPAFTLPPAIAVECRERRVHPDGSCSERGVVRIGHREVPYFSHTGAPDQTFPIAIAYNGLENTP
jgi:hypothetical protein